MTSSKPSTSDNIHPLDKTTQRSTLFACFLFYVLDIYHPAPRTYRKLRMPWRTASSTPFWQEDPGLAIYHLHFGEQDTAAKKIYWETHIRTFSLKKPFTKSPSPKFLFHTNSYVDNYCGLCNGAKWIKITRKSETLLWDFWLSTVHELCMNCAWTVHEMCLNCAWIVLQLLSVR